MTKKRGISYLRYLGKVKSCPVCKLPGYMEEWQSYLSFNYTCFTVKHQTGSRTTGRCWLHNGDGLKCLSDIGVVRNEPPK